MTPVFAAKLFIRASRGFNRFPDEQPREKYTEHLLHNLFAMIYKHGRVIEVPK